MSLESLEQEAELLHQATATFRAFCEVLGRISPVRAAEIRDDLRADFDAIGTGALPVLHDKPTYLSRLEAMSATWPDDRELEIDVLAVVLAEFGHAMKVREAITKLPTKFREGKAPDNLYERVQLAFRSGVRRGRFDKQPAGWTIRTGPPHGGGHVQT